MDALTSGRNPAAGQSDTPEPGQGSIRMREKKREERAGKPVLTEKQRIEARRKRQAQKTRRPVSGNVISRGIRATVNEARRTFAFLGRALLGAFDQAKPLGGVITHGFAGLGETVVRWLTVAAALAAAGIRFLGRVLLALDRQITNRRGLILTGLTAAVLLVVSQFLDFRAIEIGQPGYTAVQDIAQAPRLESQTPIDSHSLILVAAGLLAGVATVGIALRGLRLAGLAVAAAGALTLVVTLLVDLPAGLDTADAELAFSGVKAILLSGFWLEVGAGVVLTVSGLALALTAAPARRPARANSHRRTVNRPVSGSRA